MASSGRELKLPEEPVAEIYRCFRCGYCRSACPTFTAMGSESWNARGRLMLARAILEGQVELSPSLLDRFFSCLACAACEVVCPAVVRVVDALVAFRQTLVASGAPLPERVAELARRLLEEGSPLPGAGERGRQPEAPAGEKAGVLVFPGCVASGLEPGVVKAIEKLLEAAEVPYSLLEGACCALPLLKLGFTREARKSMELLAGRLRSLRPELVLTPCPTCLEALTRYLPQLTGTSVRAEHTSTFLRRLLREGKLALARRVELKAAYHDPCVLGRLLGIYEAPRELLWEAGLTVLEMPRNRQESACCGYGCLAFLTYPELAARIAEERVREALAVKADVLATACPSCLHALAEAAKSVARLLAVADVTEVLAELV